MIISSWLKIPFIPLHNIIGTWYFTQPSIGHIKSWWISDPPHLSALSIGPTTYEINQFISHCRYFPDNILPMVSYSRWQFEDFSSIWYRAIPMTGGRHPKGVRAHSGVNSLDFIWIILTWLESLRNVSLVTLHQNRIQCMMTSARWLQMWKW